MQGVDVSQYQGNIDFAKMKAKLGVDGFVIVRALHEDGLSIDSRFKVNWDGAKAAGLKRGLYIPYCQWIAAGRQLFALLEVCHADFGELPPAIDIESVDAVWTLAQNRALQWTMWALEKACGKVPLIYTRANYWDAYVGYSPSGNPTPTSRDNSWAKHYGLWVASYLPTPTLPATWKDYKFWQWTVNRGHGADWGVQSADLDLDVDNVAPPPPPPPHSVATFTATPETIIAGQSVTLSWDAPGASLVKLGGTQVPVTFSMPFSPPATAYYLLHVSYAGEPDVTLRADVQVVPAPPPVVATHYLGVNVIGEAGIALELSGVGCKAFTIVDNPTVCEQIKQAHPDAVVVNRRWSTDQFNGQQQWDKFGAAGHGVINEIFNEQDGHHDYSPVASLRLRIDQEFKYCDIARSKGYDVALGCFSQGTPEFNDPDIVAQLSRYAARYNNDPGVYLSVHNYSPNLAHIDNDADLIWYELRWTKFFTMCGLNPALRKVIVTETQVDQQGTGGMKSLGATPAQFTHWCTRYNEIITRPVMGHPSPVIASTIYCYTRGKAWPGHDVSQWHAELAARW